MPAACPYDAESQIKTAAGVTYAYDGSGRRVSKSNGKLYWYGSGGEILAETNASGATLNEYIFFAGRRIAMLPSGGNAEFYAEDFLGSSRVMTTNNGTVCYDADFDPYGGEHAYVNNCPSTNAYKFEGKERDTETGNDDFGARYYSSRFGRWLSADWSAVPVPVPYANLTNPQTLNLYAMVADDPESFADLDGHCGIITMPGAASATQGCSNSSTHDLQGEGSGDGNSGIAAVECSAGGESCASSAEVSAETAQIAAQEQAAANANQQNQNPEKPQGDNQQKQPNQPDQPQQPDTPKPPSWDPKKPLPDSPDKLGPDWKPDPQHDPGGKSGDERYVNPNGDKIDWHKGDPNGKGYWDRHDHWHWVPGGKKEKWHYEPGDSIKSATVKAVIVTAVVLYWIVSEGSRILFPLRNAVPAP